MNIPKAIETLKEIQMNFADEMTADDLNSLQLGIEALKLVEKRRRFAVPLMADLLPGETKD